MYSKISFKVCNWIIMCIQYLIDLYEYLQISVSIILLSQSTVTWVLKKWIQFVELAIFFLYRTHTQLNLLKRNLSFGSSIKTNAYQRFFNQCSQPLHSSVFFFNSDTSSICIFSNAQYCVILHCWVCIFSNSSTALCILHC